MPTITPFLWFDTQAEEAMNFYVSIFSRSRVVKVDRAQGKVMSVEFELEGQRFLGLNAGPHHKFNEAVSFFVACDTQAEIDALWAKLLEGGGRPDQCGWLKDKFGLSWQIIPGALRGLLTDPDPARAKRAMDAMLGMQKLDLAKLVAARDGK
jgi:predicted 3-demethylubiquinone-9 3-methyltransferase (glyoxalase superfamily)